MAESGRVAGTSPTEQARKTIHSGHSHASFLSSRAMSALQPSIPPPSSAALERASREPIAGEAPFDRGTRADTDALVASGHGCREPIDPATPRPAVHAAAAVRRAIRS
jgi:hypothetical protein